MCIKYANTFILADNHEELISPTCEDQRSKGLSQQHVSTIVKTHLTARIIYL